MKVTQHTKYDDNYNLIEYIEKNELGKITLSETYTYNKNNIRLTKTVNDILIEYFYDDKGLLNKKEWSDGRYADYKYTGRKSTHPTGRIILLCIRTTYSNPASAEFPTFSQNHCHIEVDRHGHFLREAHIDSEGELI
jgi:hypothetical protein